MLSPGAIKQSHSRAGSLSLSSTAASTAVKDAVAFTCRTGSAGGLPE
jgi:hypothetical protein